MAVLKHRVPDGGIETGGEIIAEAFSHGTHLATTPVGILVMLNSMPVLVEDNISIFSIVDTTVTKMNRIVTGGIETIIVCVPVCIGQSWEITNPVGNTRVIVETQRMKISLDRIHCMVDHYLLKAVIISSVIIDSGHFISVDVRQKGAVQCGQVDKFTYQQARTRACHRVEPLQRHGDSLSFQCGIIRVIVVNEICAIALGLPWICFVHMTGSIHMRHPVFPQQNFAGLRINKGQEIGQWCSRISHGSPCLTNAAILMSKPDRFRSGGEIGLGDTGRIGRHILRSHCSESCVSPNRKFS